MDEGPVGIHFGALRSDYGSPGALFQKLYFPRNTFLVILEFLQGCPKNFNNHT